MFVLTHAVFAMETLAEEDTFASFRGDLNRGKAFAKKALKQIVVAATPEDKTKYKNTATKYKLLIVPESSPKAEEVIVSKECLGDLASFAIGNQCVGCEREDWRKCELRVTLQDAGIPAANDCKKDCQYRQ